MWRGGFVRVTWEWRAFAVLLDAGVTAAVPGVAASRPVAVTELREIPA
jgi:hypothetical protein